MKIYRLAEVHQLPTKEEIISALVSHPLVGNIGRVKSIWVIGSFATQSQHDTSDIDVLIEIAPIKDMTASQFEEKKRLKLIDYFLKHNIKSKDDSIHPQWRGRRIDVYFTYDAAQETRPKIKL